MKNVIEIKNVRNVNNDVEGILYLIGSVDVEATKCDNVNHYGLSVFFRPYDDDIKAQYIKSFVLTTGETRLFRRGKINIIKDIGYILSVQNTTLDIICLGYANTTSKENHFSNQKINRATFELMTDGEGYDKLVEETKIAREDMCGFRLAVSKAFGTMLNITEDSIVPSIFPGEANVVEFDYCKSMNK